MMHLFWVDSHDGLTPIDLSFRQIFYQIYFYDKPDQKQNKLVLHSL